MIEFKVVTDVEANAEPISLSEARLQVKEDTGVTTYDTLLTGVINPGARKFAEHANGRAYATRTLEAALDAFPEEDYIDLPMPPVASITSIKYDDASGTEQTLSSSVYALSTYGDARRVSLTYGNSWPITRDHPNAVRIRYVTGSACPAPVKAAMLLHVELEYPNCSHTPAEREAKEKARDALLQTNKLYG